MNKQGIAAFFITIVCLAACTPKATRLAKKAEKQFEQAEYQLSIDNYQQALAKGYDKGSEANYKIAEAFRRSNRIHESENFYEKALASNLEEEEAQFWYAFSLKSNGKYENAKQQFQKYISQGTNFDLVNRAKKELANLDVISEIVAKSNSNDYEVRNIEQLNSPNAEYSPFMNKGKLYFTTNRGVTEMHAATNTGFTDVWEFIFDGIETFSGQAQTLPKEINTPNAHEADAVFSKDGKVMYFSRSNTGSKKGIKDVQIYMSKQQAGIWGEPVHLPINDVNAWNAHPHLSPDGKRLYFSSNRDGGNGGNDIYVSTIDSTGNWGNVKNLGTPINTRGNDMFPYEDENGVFYFSSDGHPSLGALDLFKVVKDEEGKVAVKNLGKPINSSYDDFSIFVKDSTTGYFSSNRPDGKGDDDVYEYNAYKNAIYAVKGVTVTKDSNLVIANAEVTITKLNGDTVATVTSDEEGNFVWDVEPEQEYVITASKEGFLFYEDKYSTVGKTVKKEDLKIGDNHITFDQRVEMTKKAVDIVLVVDNVYYDFNKWDIRPDAAIALNVVVDFLVKNPDITIELSSHTDERGSDTYNRNLSQKRAQSAVDYVVSKGVENERIVAKGYGEDKPIFKNAQSEEEHQTNRRTEIKITGITNPNIKIINKGDEERISPEP